MGIVTDYLRQQLTRLIDEHNTVLWFDPDRHYTVFVQELRLPNVTVARYEGSFFALRYEIDHLFRGDHPPRLLVYVPLAEEETHEALSEVAATAAIIKPGHGSAQRNSRLAVIARRALRPVLGEEKASDIARQVEAGRLDLADLDRIGSADGGSAVIKGIFGVADARSVALMFLDSDRYDAAIHQRNAIAEIAQLCEHAFGIAFPADVDCAALRLRLARHLLTIEFLISLAGPLPPALATIALPQDPETRAFCAAVVREWRSRRDLHRYVEYAEQVEHELGLRQITFTLDHLRTSETFAATEHVLQAAVEQALVAQPADDIIELVNTRITGFWSEQRPAIKARWLLIQSAGLLLREAARVERALKDAPSDLAALLQAYAEGDEPWCLLDTYQRHLERRWHTFELSDLAESATLEQLITRARQRFMEVGDRLATVFTKAIGQSGGVLAAIRRQRDIFAAYVKPALAEGKTAYILVDALRFEMARELQRGFDDEYQRQLVVAVATVPTITEIGMAALMPGAEGEVSIVPASPGKVGLRIGSAVLKDRQSRLAWLRQQVNEPLVITTLEGILPKPAPDMHDQLQQARLIVVTSQEIDELAERDNIRLARKLMDDVLADLARLVRKLREYGCKTIVIAADHGYIFGDELDSSMKIDPPGGQTIDLHRRVWIGSGGAAGDAYLRLKLKSFGLGSDFDIAVPWGLGAFKVPGGGRAYFHGGMAPQELAVPVLILKPVNVGKVTPLEAIQWGISLSTQKIANRFFSVQITARSKSLFQFDPPRVRIDVRAKGSRVAEVVAATYGFVESAQEIELRVQADNPQQIDPNTITMMINDPNVKAVTVHLLDATTGRELAKIEKIEVALLAL